MSPTLPSVPTLRARPGTPGLALFTPTALAWLAALAGAGALAALALSAAWTPEAMAAGEPLLVVGITPEPCPGCPLCGMSRAFASMTRLDPARAVGFNRGVVVLYPLFVLVAALGPAFALRTAFTRSRPCAPSPRS